MRLIVGLGNPGKKYEKTRHNLGFRVIERLQSSNHPVIQSSILFKPQKFMNLSGPEVLKKLNFYRLKPKNLIVIYDDIDLPLGEIRLRHKGSSAGHQGVQSIIEALGSEDFIRVRIGIGRPALGKEAEKYVLENFSPAEEENIRKAIDQAAEKVIEKESLWVPNE